MSEAYFIFTFSSTQEVIKVEKELKAKKYKIKIIPMPKEIKHSAQFALQVPLAKMEEVKKMYKVQKTRIYFVEVEGIEKQIMKKW